MINKDSLNYYIDSSFHTRGQTPIKIETKKVSQYVDDACKDKGEILRKLRKINYNKFFGNNFQTAKIDKNFEGIDNQGKANIIGNVIDLLFYD